MNSSYISATDLSRFEHAKEEFKQQMCLNVDTLFNVFLAELNSNQKLDSNVSLSQLSNNETNTEQFNHNNERNNNQLISNQQQEVSLNIESQQSGLNLEIHSPNGRSHFDFDLSADFPIQNNQQQQQQMLNVTIKQEILDEDEQLFVRDDNQEQPLLNDGHLQNTQNIELSNLNLLNPEKATNNQTSFGESQVTDCISYSYDDDIFDEELLREVKKEILDEEEEKQIVLAKRRKIDMSVTDSNQNDTVQIGGSNDETNSFSDINSDDDDDASTNDQILINKDNTNDNTDDSFSDISDRSLDELLNEFDSTDDDSSHKGKRPEKKSKHNSKSNEKPSRIKTTKNISPLKEERIERSTSSSSPIFSNRIRTDTEMSKSGSKSSSRKRCHNENRHQFLTISLNCPKDGCHSKYSSASVLQDHMLAKHNSYAYVCPIAKCSKSFTSRSNMKCHGREDHKGIDSYVCRKCHFWNTDIDFVFTHYYMEHEEGQFKCTKSNCDHVSKCRADACKHANDH